MITDLLSLLEKRNRLREEEARAIFVRLVLATKATSPRLLLRPGLLPLAARFRPLAARRPLARSPLAWAAA